MLKSVASLLAPSTALAVATVCAVGLVLILATEHQAAITRGSQLASLRAVIAEDRKTELRLVDGLHSALQAGHATLVAQQVAAADVDTALQHACALAKDWAAADKLLAAEHDAVLNVSLVLHRARARVRSCHDVEGVRKAVLRNLRTAVDAAEHRHAAKVAALAVVDAKVARLEHALAQAKEDIRAQRKQEAALLAAQHAEEVAAAKEEARAARVELELHQVKQQEEAEAAMAKAKSHAKKGRGKMLAREEQPQADESGSQAAGDRPAVRRELSVGEIKAAQHDEQARRAHKRDDAEPAQHHRRRKGRKHLAEPAEGDAAQQHTANASVTTDAVGGGHTVDKHNASAGNEGGHKEHRRHRAAHHGSNAGAHNGSTHNASEAGHGRRARHGEAEANATANATSNATANATANATTTTLAGANSTANSTHAANGNATQAEGNATANATHVTHRSRGRDGDVVASNSSAAAQRYSNASNATGHNITNASTNGTEQHQQHHRRHRNRHRRHAADESASGSGKSEAPKNDVDRPEERVTEPQN